MPPLQGVAGLATLDTNRNEGKLSQRASRPRSQRAQKPKNDDASSEGAGDDESPGHSQRSVATSRLNRSFRNRNASFNRSFRRGRLLGLAELGRASPVPGALGDGSTGAAPASHRVDAGELPGGNGPSSATGLVRGSGNRRGSVAATLAGVPLTGGGGGHARGKAGAGGPADVTPAITDADEDGPEPPSAGGPGGRGGAHPLKRRWGGLLAHFSEPDVERRYRAWSAARHSRRAARAVLSWLAAAVVATILCAALGGRALSGAMLPYALALIAYLAVVSAVVVGALFVRAPLLRQRWQALATAALAGVLVWLAVGLAYSIDPLLYALFAVLAVQSAAALLGVRAAAAVALLAAACGALIVEAAVIGRLREQQGAWEAVFGMLAACLFCGHTAAQGEVGERREFGRGARMAAVRSELQALRARAEGEAGRSGTAGGADSGAEAVRKLSNVVVTPMEVVMRRINDMREDALAEGADAVAEGLDSIAELLAGHSNLFAPSVFAIDSAAATADDDGIARWLQSELAAPAAPAARERAPLPPLRSIAHASVSVSSDIGPPPPAPALVSEADARLAKLLASSLRWECDTFELDAAAGGHGLRVLAAHVLRETGLVRRLAIPQAPLERFLEYAELDYQPNCYHNHVHAADVLQAVASSLAASADLRRALPDLDLLAVVLAAVVHDMGHEGRNNNFEMATASERALVYNDRSVLENYHVSRCFLLLRIPECDFLAGMAPADRRALRRAVISAVLATDISQHFDNLGAFKARSALPEFLASDEDRQITVNMLLKCADLGNAARPLRVYRAWADCVMAEFFEQGDDEKRLGLPVSPWMDRDAPQASKCQSGFIDFLVEPLYAAWAACFPDFEPHLAHVRANRSFWRKVEEGEAPPEPSSRRSPPPSGAPDAAPAPLPPDAARRASGPAARGPRRASVLPQFVLPGRATAGGPAGLPGYAGGTTDEEGPPGSGPAAGKSSERRDAAAAAEGEGEAGAAAEAGGGRLSGTTAAWGGGSPDVRGAGVQRQGSTTSRLPPLALDPPSHDAVSPLAVGPGGSLRALSLRSVPAPAALPDEP